MVSAVRKDTTVPPIISALLVCPLLTLGVYLAACGTQSPASPPPHDLPSGHPCPPQPGHAFETLLLADTYLPLCPEAAGGGAFGRWIIDRYGLRAYLYTIDQDRDERALYYTSKGLSNDHWHQLGNDTITVTAHNKGYLQYWDWGRGGKCLNRYQPERGNFSGGFKFVKMGDLSWNTLYDATGFDAFRRVFGMGYAEKETSRQGIELRERIYVPYGEDPLVVSETFLRNTTASSKRVSLYEYWDFNLYELLAAPIMTAPFGELFEEARWLFNRAYFEVASSYDPETCTLYVEPRLSGAATAPPPDAVSIADYYPKATFLASLTGPPRDVFTDQDSFFGNGGLANPDGVRYGLPSAVLGEAAGDIDRACLIMRKDLELEPGEEVFISYAFGSAQRQRIPDLVEKYREAPGTNFEKTISRWSRERIDLVTPEAEAPWLRNELLWHGYYLASGSFFEDYFDSHIVNQGSAYAYIHGANGAHRDFALFCMPLVYLRPDLAKETLRYMMRCQDASTGELPYAQQGFGYTTGAIVHEHSSDLDIFFLMAVSEYLGATRDFAFLDEIVPFYPRSSGVSAPVRDHLLGAFDHLRHVVGTGPHGLVRAGTGDWNDVLIAFSATPLLTTICGESNLNSAMAAFVLPRLARVLENAMPEFSRRLVETSRQLAERLPGEWAGKWMRRGYLGNGAYLGEDQLFLDAQPWSILAGVWDADRTRTLLGTIKTSLVDPSPAGVLSLEPPKGPPLVPGSDTNGGTWAAIDSWLVWAWAATDPGAAWECFLKTTLNRHAEAYPEIWYGIWSGPDSFNAFYAERPGETFNWSVTPMTDFPVMNMNRHSGPLLDAIRLAGIDPCGERIEIDPKLPFSSFALKLPLVGIAYLDDRARGYYVPQAHGLFAFRIRIPRACRPDAIRLVLCERVYDRPVVEGGFVLFEAPSEKGKRITWEIGPR